MLDLGDYLAGVKYNMLCFFIFGKSSETKMNCVFVTIEIFCIFRGAGPLSQRPPFLVFLFPETLLHILFISSSGSGATLPQGHFRLGQSALLLSGESSRRHAPPAAPAL